MGRKARAGMSSQEGVLPPVPAQDSVAASEGIVGDAVARRRGRGWYGDPERHAQAGHVGGTRVAQDRAHMAAIGRKGGCKVAQDRAHMAAIGRRGGLRAAEKRKHVAPGEPPVS
ncbi:MAG: hypothetical protein RMJ43_15615 [Chloroherpetonaceae bacterium]|nr:hypothetical protein [Chthonomonadaceae bacterium]MDW8209262.1 hypothetical protein [Chloroherpetonaceae bacterium]